MAVEGSMAGIWRKKLRVLELYSGIGGTHWALKESGIPYEVVGAADINNVANDIYRHNFKDTKIFQKVIESFTVQELDKLSPDVITMSPPCQPFTRVGLQRDSSDQRTKSFFHVLHLLPQLAKLPSYILLENVKGFETSLTHQELLDTLTQCQYSIQEFLLTPNQFGIPNSRLRYYLLAKRPGLSFNFPTHTRVRDDIPECMEPHLIHKVRPGQHSPTTHSPTTHSPTTHSPTTHSPNTHSPTTHSPTTGPALGTNSNTLCDEPCETKRLKISPDTGEEEGSVGSEGVSTPALSDSTPALSDSTPALSDSTPALSGSTPALSDSTPISVATVGGVKCDHSVEQCAQHSQNVNELDHNLDESGQTRDSPTQGIDKGGECGGGGGGGEGLSHRERYQYLCRPVGAYLEPGLEEDRRRHLVDEKFFRRFWCMDIIQADARSCCCFTKAYGHRIEGAGSILQTVADAKVDLNIYKEKRAADETTHDAVRALGLRFFSPREVANIMCFPQYFSFPGNLTAVQCYRVLGNSLNVHVVSVLLRLLYYGDDNVWDKAT